MMPTVTCDTLGIWPKKNLTLTYLLKGKLIARQIVLMKVRERRRERLRSRFAFDPNWRYCSDTSSTLKLVGNVMSLVPRNWIRTVWPANELRLNGPLRTYTPAVPLF